MVNIVLNMAFVPDDVLKSFRFESGHIREFKASMDVYNE